MNKATKVPALLTALSCAALLGACQSSGGYTTTSDSGSVATTATTPTTSVGRPADTTTSGTSARADTMAPSMQFPEDTATYTVPASLTEVGAVGIFAMADSTEINEGNLAASKASNEDVKEYAKMLVNDHTHHLGTLATVLPQGGQTTWQQDAAATARAASVMQRLQSLSGADFDRAFLHHEIREHDQIIAIGNQILQNTQSQAVKTMVTNTLATLKEHRDKAQQLLSKVGGN
jgi:putative membrane protein